MMQNLIRAVRATIVIGVLTGLAYPLVMTGIAQVAMSNKADGSLITQDGAVVGSTMIGQLWKGKDWFYGRPSAVDYDASISSGSNLGPNSQTLADDIEQRVQQVLKLESPYNPDLTTAGIPADLVTASASGLDPDISVAAAKLQAARVAALHGLSLDQVMSMIDDHTTGRVLGFLGEPRVNVLQLNLALQRLES